MIDIEPLVRRELDEHVPPPDPALMDWQGVLVRAGEPARQRRSRVAALAVVAASLVMLAVTPLGGAVARTVGGFSDWLTGTPGEPAPEDVQRMFDEANQRSGAPFPGDPELRELLRIELGERKFFLYGFETGGVVCLRVAVRALEGAGPAAACASRADLRRSGDLVLPVKGNLGVGRIGPLPRDADDPPTVARYLLTFGLAAAEVERVSVESDEGVSAAVVRNGAFLHVLEPGHRGNWVRAVRAETRDGRVGAVPISVQVSGQPPLATGLKLHGPATVEREVRNGTIGWFVRREPRGVPGREAGLGRRGDCCSGFSRVVYPDPSDFLGVSIGDETLMPRLPRPSRFLPTGDDVICFGLVSRGGRSASCTNLRRMFREGPLAVSWGFSGAGQQIWQVSGLVSDDVARIEVFQGDGERWQAPLRDNATAFRVPRAKFPVRIVGYDDDGRVIGVRTIRGG